MSWRFLLLILFAATAAPAFAQEDEQSQIVVERACTGGQHWRPSLSDTRAISNAPVPASYRKLFESTTDCVRWALDEDSLIDWHLAFGDAKSTAAALRYLEADYTRAKPAPSRLVGAFRDAVAAVRPDIELAYRRPQAENAAAYRALEKTRSFTRLNFLLRTREDFIFLAEQYLRAAEEYRDLQLLRQAQAYLGPAAEGAVFLAPIEKEPTFERRIYFNLQTFRTDDLLARAALLKLQITNAPVDLAVTDKLLSAQEPSMFKQALDNAYQTGDACDVVPNTGWEAEILAACRADFNYSARVLNQAVNRAELEFIRRGVEGSNQRDLFAEGMPPEYDEIAKILSQQSPPWADPRGHSRLANEDLLRVWRAQFDDIAKRKPLPEDVLNYRYAARATLKRAQSLAQPYDAPARFRRLATAWLDRWDLDVKDRPDLPELDSASSLYANYLRATLKSLD